MPVFQVFTNVAKSKCTPAFAKRLQAILVEKFDKPSVLVHVTGDQTFAFKDDTPSAYGVIHAVDMRSISKTKRVDAITAFQNEAASSLGVQADSFPILMNDYSPLDCGIANTLVEAIFEEEAEQAKKSK